MISWIMQNLGTIIVALVLVLIVILAVAKIVHNKKSTGCAGGCAGCKRTRHPES